MQIQYFVVNKKGKGLHAMLYLCRVAWVSYTHTLHLKIIVREPPLRMRVRVAHRWLSLSGKSRIHLTHVSFFHKFAFQVLFLATLDICVLLLNFNYLFIIYYSKGAKAIQWGKGESFQQMLENCISTCRRMKLDPCLTPYTNIISDASEEEGVCNICNNKDTFLKR